MQDPDNFITPDSLQKEFEKMTDKEKKIGKELMVTGYSLSLKTWILMSKNKASISPKLTKYLEGIPRELAVVDRIYPNLTAEYKTWGNKFAIQHRSDDIMFIEPFEKTHMIGFEEFYHKKGLSLREFFSSLASVKSEDTGKDLSSCILFEGDYVTAFGIVKYQVSDDKLSMTKPIAIVKGGMEALWNFFKQKRNEKAGQVYGFLVFATILTAASIGMFVGAKYYYNKVQERQAEEKNNKTEMENMVCAKCGNNKRNILFEP